MTPTGEPAHRRWVGALERVAVLHGGRWLLACVIGSLAWDCGAVDDEGDAVAWVAR
jgi:hypothetical protein